MGNTYTQIIVQLVFAVKRRQKLIPEDNRESLEKYICGIVSLQKSKPLAIYCNPDHIHILIGLHPSVSISDMVKEVKVHSSIWINQQSWMTGRFNWQRGFGAFTYSKSSISNVVRYILNQAEHHRVKTFETEYKNLLDSSDVDYDEKYLFNFRD